MYSDILGKKKSCKVLLQTYFGDVRDVYEDIVKLSFDGIGLDLLRERRQQNSLKIWISKGHGIIRWTCKWKEYLEEPL